MTTSGNAAQSIPTSPAAEMIDLRDVTVVTRGRMMFDHFNFTISRGEHWIIQGENGAGKTSLLQVITGNLPHVSGEVSYSFIHGDDWDTRYHQRQKKIHMVPATTLNTFLQGFETFYQQRYYTVEDTCFPKVRDLFHADGEHPEALKLSESFGITNLLDLDLPRLSNGQVKKVVILSHLVKGIPEFLLLDYPFDGLDARSRHDLSSFIDDVAAHLGVQVVLVDHHQEFPAVINRRLVLRNFRVVNTEEVSRRHSSPSKQVPAASAVPATDNRETVVEMRDLSIRYGGKTIIDSLHWKVHRGERWALTGRNGSGKTTLFSLIYADHPMAYSEQVFLFGKRRGSGESIWDIKKRINYLGPEQMHFLNTRGTALSGREHILARVDDPERLDTLVSFFDAAKYIHKALRDMSSGELQMALLIDFFMVRKELLLLDEPFQFLDPANKERVRLYLEDYLDDDATLILITHHETDVLEWTQLRKVL